MTYEAVKKDEPLRLVVDLPHTVSNTVSYLKVLDNEIIDFIDILVIVHSPQPKTRVVIGLNRDIAYEISRRQEEIRVSFGAPTSLSKTDSAPDKKATESVADVSSTEARQARTAAAPRLPEEKSEYSATAHEATGSLSRVSPFETMKTRMVPIPRLSEEKSGYSARDAGESNSPPASKLLEIRAVEVEEKLIISLLANGSLHNYRTFHLTNPSRLVVDIMGIQSTRVKSVSDFGGPLVDKIRVAPRKGRVRVIFDLVPQLGLPYQVVSGNDRLQISFSMNTLQGVKTRAAAGATGTSQKETEALYHQVSDGDTLFSIGRRYGVTVEELRRLNDLEPEALVIYPDQKLLVRPQSDR
jgi:membrane-bound lytic murein transglycosylase D